MEVGVCRHTGRFIIHPHACMCCTLDFHTLTHASATRTHTHAHTHTPLPSPTCPPPPPHAVQTECGSAYTKKLVAMYRDWSLKDDMMERFRDAVKMARPSRVRAVAVLWLCYSCGVCPWPQRERERERDAVSLPQCPASLSLSLSRSPLPLFLLPVLFNLTRFSLPARVQCVTRRSVTHNSEMTSRRLISASMC